MNKENIQEFAGTEVLVFGTETTERHESANLQPNSDGHFRILTDKDDLFAAGYEAGQSLNRPKTGF